MKKYLLSFVLSFTFGTLFAQTYQMTSKESLSKQVILHSQPHSMSPSSV